MLLQRFYVFLFLQLRFLSSIFFFFGGGVIFIFISRINLRLLSIIICTKWIICSDQEDNDGSFMIF